MRYNVNSKFCVSTVLRLDNNLMYYVCTKTIHPTEDLLATGHLQALGHVYLVEVTAPA